MGQADPDVLRVESLELTDDDVVAGEFLHGAWVIAGSADGQAIVWLDVVDTEWGTIVATASDLQASGRDHGDTGEATPLRLGDPGDYRLRIRVDPEGYWNDGYPENNELTIPLVVRVPSPVRFETAGFSVWIEGTGNGTRDQILVRGSFSADHIPAQGMMTVVESGVVVATGQVYNGSQFPTLEGAYKQSEDRYLAPFGGSAYLDVEEGQPRNYTVHVTFDAGAPWASSLSPVYYETRPITCSCDPPNPPPPKVRHAQHVTDPEPTDEVEPPSPERRLHMEVHGPVPDPEHPGAWLVEVDVTAEKDAYGVSIVPQDHDGWTFEQVGPQLDLTAGEKGSFVLRWTPQENGTATRSVTVAATGMGAGAASEIHTIEIPKGIGAPGATVTGLRAWPSGYVTAGISASATALVALWVAVSEPRRFAVRSALARLLGALGGAALFSRIEGDKVLEHEARDRIHECIRQNPGIHYRRLMRELQMSNGRLMHHVRTLGREGVVRMEPDGRLLRFFAVGMTAKVGTALTDRQRTLLSRIKQRPGILQSSLAAEFGVSRQALAQHVAALREQRLVLDSNVGRTKALYLENDVDTRLVDCKGCATLYDRGSAVLGRVVCPGCGDG